MLHNTRFSDLTVSQVVRFNPEHANLVGMRSESMLDGYSFCFEHRLFPVVPEGMIIPQMSLSEAKVKYPFLFVDTNPLLYKRFQ
jgi:hypothetical protein